MIFKILYLTTTLFYCEPTTYDVVEEFHKLDNKLDEMQFINNHAKNPDPSIVAYVLSVSMKQADYEFNPYRKLKIFQTNKTKLDFIITENPRNPHLRYVRLLLQEKLPTFLGYNNHIVEDKNFLNTLMNQTDKTDYLDYYIVRNTSL